jgi:hypothetical protein
MARLLVHRLAGLRNHTLSGLGRMRSRTAVLYYSLRLHLSIRLPTTRLPLCRFALSSYTVALDVSKMMGERAEPSLRHAHGNNEERQFVSHGVSQSRSLPGNIGGVARATAVGLIKRPTSTSAAVTSERQLQNC